ncbi:hypothetical protein [Streptomyces lavendulae]|uniref:hypothetical protein n=1 Tax=Streptomyces lavendulae TaxID=1914 RepID=UPI0024A2B31F|nr:hypothetical protein [Streptomyces lavendulae]GLW00902.1 hypothetical protein Slala05_45330 [Streptomyces lavendulae subsp. lavendulae]
MDLTAELRTCDWCSHHFLPRNSGGHPQRFCTPVCRRLWLEKLAKRRKQMRRLAVLIKTSPEPRRSFFVEYRRLVQEAIDALERQRHAARVLS